MPYAAHTPGPWRLGKRETTVYGGTNGDKLICSCGSLTKRPITEQIGNARLIIAAPSLLDVCLKYLALPPSERGCMDLEVLIREAVNLAIPSFFPGEEHDTRE